jgi:hypothetical protein
LFFISDERLLFKNVRIYRYFFHTQLKISLLKEIGTFIVCTNLIPMILLVSFGGRRRGEDGRGHTDSF